MEGRRRDGPSLLLSPLAVGRLRLRNRVMMMATVNNLGSNRCISDRQIAFYEERARGGVAAIVTEGMSVHPTSIPNATIPLAYREELLPDLTKLATAVHRHGASIYAQLWHVGRNALWSPLLVPWSPSPERDPFSGTTPHAMTVREIRELIEAFASTADRMRRAGFDGVELHGAHGYLIQQFLSPWSNKRLDDYGGSAEGRTLFVRSVIERIRDVCGPDLVVGLKLSVAELVEGGLTLEDSKEIVRIIRAASPPDYFGVSQSNFATLEHHVPDMRAEWAPFIHLAEGIRDVAGGVPVVFMGRVRDAEHAEELLARRAADIIGMARPLIADAALVRKTQEGQSERTRPCIFCNVCWEAIHSERPITCIHAPEAGRELELRGASTTRPDGSRRVVRVVGAGPAGLSVALAAVRNGHVAHVYDERESPGGQTMLAELVPGRVEYAKVGRYLASEAQASGVTFHLGSPIDARHVEGWLRATDVVVLATGSVPAPPPLPGSGRARTLESALERRDWTATSVVIVDEIDDEPTYAVAEAIASRGARVRLLTRRPQIGRRSPFVSLAGAFRRLDLAGIPVVPLREAVRMEERTLVVRHVYSGHEDHLEDVDVVVWAGPYAARDGLANELSSRGHRIRSVGDSYAPRGARVAIFEGHELGSAI